MTQSPSEYYCAKANLGDGNPDSFFQTIQDLYYCSEKESECCIERNFTIAGYPIRLRFSEKALVSLLTPAFEHLSENNNFKPVLTILVGTDNSSGISLPFVPFKSKDKDMRGSLWQFQNGGQDIIAQLSDEIYNILDRKGNRGISWFRNNTPIPQNEIGSPLLKILHWWMQDHGRQLVHAGAVGIPQGGVLLVGKGGSGKSTAALACLNSELYYAADDYCLISNNPHPHAYSLYCSGKVKASDTCRFAFLDDAMSEIDPVSGKALYFIFNRFPEKVVSGFPIKALVLPRVKGNGKTTVRSISPGLCMLMLGPSTVSQLPVGEDRTFKNLAELARRVPSYILEMGMDISGIPRMILDLINDRG